MTTLRLGRAEGTPVFDITDLSAMTGLNAATITCACKMLLHRMLGACAVTERQRVLQSLGIPADATPPCGRYGSVPTGVESYCERARPEQFEMLTALLMQRLRRVLPEEACDRIAATLEV